MPDEALTIKEIAALLKLAEKTRVRDGFSGAPMFTGGAGSGESEIRRWLLEERRSALIAAAVTGQLDVGAAA